MGNITRREVITGVAAVAGAYVLTGCWSLGENSGFNGGGGESGGTDTDGSIINAVRGTDTDSIKTEPIQEAIIMAGENNPVRIVSDLCTEIQNDRNSLFADKEFLVVGGLNGEVIVYAVGSAYKDAIYDWTNPWIASGEVFERAEIAIQSQMEAGDGDIRKAVPHYQLNFKQDGTVVVLVNVATKVDFKVTYGAFEQGGSLFGMPESNLRFQTLMKEVGIDGPFNNYAHTVIDTTRLDSLVARLRIAVNQTQ